MSAALDPSDTDWLVPWKGPANLQAAVDGLARRGHVVVLTGRTTGDLPPALPEEIVQAAQSVDPDGYLVRRRMARLLAATALGGAPEALRIKRTPAGAPVFETGPLHLSFSARGEAAVIALGETRVGVDLEPALPPAGIAWNLLRKDERAGLLTLPPAAQGPAFLVLWRAKEAVVKAMGCGFALAPEAVRLTAGVASAEGHAGRFALLDDASRGIGLARAL